jgi:hypothetical protein
MTSLSGSPNNGYVGVYDVTSASNPKIGIYVDASNNGKIEIFESGPGTNQITLGKIAGVWRGAAGVFQASVPTTAASGEAAIVGQSNNANLHLAGFFSGTVRVSGTLTKSGGSFQIDHPQDPANKYLYHSFVESPDMMNVYNGNIKTDVNGDATVSLPAYFEVENIDFKYQLTVIGQFAQAIIAEEVSNNQFKIKTDKPNVKVSWQITGVRNDEWAQKHRIVPEVDKESYNKGKYLHPELFGQPVEKGIHYRPNLTQSGDIPKTVGINAKIGSK